MDAETAKHLRFTFKLMRAQISHVEDAWLAAQALGNVLSERLPDWGADYERHVRELRRSSTFHETTRQLTDSLDLMLSELPDSGKGRSH